MRGARDAVCRGRLLAGPKRVTGRLRAGPYIAIVLTLFIAASAHAASRTFAIRAHQFQFDVTPSPFVVDRGDTVTLNITASDVEHGFFLQQFAESTSFFVRAGETKAITFTANVAGDFVYFCTFVCGDGHGNMNGTFHVNDAAAQPATISGISPSSGPTAGGTLVTINGSNFQNGAAVQFGDVAGLIVNVTPTAINVLAPSHAPGKVAVTVINPGAQPVTFDGYTYVVPPPSIASISPATGPTSGATPVTISGSNFQPGATVTIGSFPATNVKVVDSNTITALTPLGPANEQVAVAFDVTVTNPDNVTAALAQAFHYFVPPLRIEAVTPGVGATSGGVDVVIRGAGFTNAVTSSVTIGGAAATNVRIVDAVTLVVTAPPHAAGSADVKVTIGSGSVTALNAFLYAAAPPRRRAIRH